MSGPDWANENPDEGFSDSKVASDIEQNMCGFCGEHIYKGRFRDRPSNGDVLSDAPTDDPVMWRHRSDGFAGCQKGNGVAEPANFVAASTAASYRYNGDGPKSLKQMAAEVYQFEVDKGWQPNDNQFGTSLALLTSEISEALDAFREVGFDRRDTPTDIGAKPDDVASELADTLIRLLSTWVQFMVPLGFDLEGEYERKMAYNRLRAYRHGGKQL